MRAAFVAVAALLTAAAPAAADDFRVETDVFLEKKAPVAQYLTLFRGGFVFDFVLDESEESAIEEIAIYDVPRQRFVLLSSPKRGVQTKLTLDQLFQLTAQVQARAAISEDADVRFMANPVFDIRPFDPQERRIVLSSKRLTYSAVGIVPPEESIVRRYERFADGYARLNGIRPGNLPPFARLNLNEQLAAHGLVPKEVTKTVVAGAVFGKQIQVRSRHLFTWRLLPTDQDKLDAADSRMQTFKHVDPATYLKWPERLARQQ
ncbi:MAG: hypothetical protein KY475_03690 [Planctomycetes bacterium]|nr:hypothetical protein [Planctomycetota bacterium]